jgi:hypothetical protein
MAVQRQAQIRLEDKGFQFFHRALAPARQACRFIQAVDQQEGLYPSLGPGCIP